MNRWFDCEPISGESDSGETAWSDCDSEPNGTCMNAAIGPPRIEDGGGQSSTADWLEPREQCDHLSQLCATWKVRIEQWKLTIRLGKGFLKGSPGLLMESECSLLRADGQEFLAKQGICKSTQISSGQPFALDPLEGLVQFCDDVDVRLPGILREGVRSGIDNDIAPSSVFPPEDQEAKLRPCPIEVGCCDTPYP